MESSEDTADWMFQTFDKKKKLSAQSRKVKAQ